MKVLHVTNNYPTPNLPIFGIFVKEQIDTLSELGVENEVFFINGYEKGKIEYFKGAFRLRKQLKKNKYDLVHCHHALSAFMHILTFKSKKQPCIVSFQNDPINEHGLRLYNRIKNNFSCFIFKNNSTLIPDLRGKGYYLPNGVNTEFFIPMDRDVCKGKLNLDKDKKYILFISSFVIRKQKRIDRFDETVALLKSKYPEENFEALKLVNVERKYMPLYFNAASIHLMTSDFEGSPNSVKECICCNTPVVSTDVGNVSDMLKGAENCFVTNDFSPDTLASLVHKSLSIKSEPRKLVFEKKLDKYSSAQKLLAIYNSLLKKYEP